MAFQLKAVLKHFSVFFGESDAHFRPGLAHQIRRRQIQHARQRRVDVNVAAIAHAQNPGRVRERFVERRIFHFGVAQRLRHRVVLGDVQQHARHAQRPAIGIALDGAAARNQPAPASKTVTDAQFAVEAWGQAFESLLQVGQQALQVLRVNARLQLAQ